MKIKDLDWIMEDFIMMISFQPQIFTLTNLSGVKPRQDLGQNGVEDMIQLTWVLYNPWQYVKNFREINLN